MIIKHAKLPKMHIRIISLLSRIIGDLPAYDKEDKGSSEEIASNHQEPTARYYIHLFVHGRIQRGEHGSPPPWKFTKIYGFLAILVQIRWKITQLQSQHSMFGHHRYASETHHLMAFFWQANDGPLIVVLDPFSPHEQKQNKKNVAFWTPSEKTFWICAYCQTKPGFLVIFWLLIFLILPENIW